MKVAKEKKDERCETALEIIILITVFIDVMDGR